MSYKKSEKKFIEAKKYLAGGVSSHFRLIFNPVPLTFLSFLKTLDVLKCAMFFFFKTENVQ